MTAQASSRRHRKTKDPCPECGLHRTLCLCDLIPRLETKTRLCLIVHHRELKRTTNTGRLAIKSLVNSELRVRGRVDHPLDLTDLLVPTYRSYLFFPTDDAVELNHALVNSNPLPIQLIVPDGNWRQASKVCSREAELKSILRVKISTPNQAEHHLRAEHKPEGMSTLESIARAFGVVEGEWAMQPLLQLYRTKLERTLVGRGVPLRTFRA